MSDAPAPLTSPVRTAAKQAYRSPGRVGLAVFAVALLVFGVSAAPGIFAWDSAELTLGIYTQGIVHSTGYPLYLMIGRLFTLLPLGEFAARANLFSAFNGAVSAGLLTMAAARLVKNPLWAGAAALAWAFSQAIWSQAVVAEVYTLHTALMAAALLLFLRWDEERTPGRLYALCLCFGLSFGVHLAAGLVAIVLLPYALLKTPCWRARLVGLLITGLVAGALYLYLPLRYAANPAFNLLAGYFDRDLTQPANLLWMASGRMFGRQMFAYDLLGWLGELAHFGGQLALNFLGVGLAFGFVGIYTSWRGNRRAAILLLAVFGLQALFFSSYNVPDKGTMFHTAYLVWAVFLAIGLERLAGRYTPRLVALGALALLAALIAANWGTAGRFNDTFVPERTAALLKVLPTGASVAGPWTTLRPIDYERIVHGQRGDLRLLDVTLLALGAADRYPTSTRAAIDAGIRAFIDAAPGEVYVIDPASLGTTGYPLVPVAGDLYRVAR
jgi:hypothetical protein